MDTSFAVTLLLSLHLHCHLLVWAAMDSCYDDEGTPSTCMPRFENLAFNRTAVASNVCGSPPEDYCMQTGSTRSCHYCDASDPDLHHNASLLTDFHRSEENTWWQSQSMYYGIQHPNSVNLTLHLGKSTAAHPQFSLTPRILWFDPQNSLVWLSSTCSSVERAVEGFRSSRYYMCSGLLSSYNVV